LNLIYSKKGENGAPAIKRPENDREGSGGGRKPINKKIVLLSTNLFQLVYLNFTPQNNTARQSQKISALSCSTFGFRLDLIVSFIPR